jgi:hypothetical protein
MIFELHGVQGRPGDRVIASNRQSAIAHRQSFGLSIVEMLIALSISAVLLIAVTAAIDVSFYAYASAAESASTQSASRLVMQRLITMIRTTTLHDAYDPADPAVTLADPSQPPVQCVGLEMVDSEWRLTKVWWAVNAAYADADLGDLWYQLEANAGQPMLEQVRIQRTSGGLPYLFTLSSRMSDSGLLLHRATVDLTVEAGADATLALEAYQGAADPVRLIASTVPRKTLDIAN